MAKYKPMPMPRGPGKPATGRNPGKPVKGPSSGSTVMSRTQARFRAVTGRLPKLPVKPPKKKPTPRRD